MSHLNTRIGIRSGATGINDAGEVVGISSTIEGRTHAFITGPDGTNVRYLDSLGGYFNEAYDINEAGQVVGTSYPLEGRAQTVITGPDGVGVRDLGTLGGDSFGYGINDAGQVVGASSIAEENQHAFVTGPDGVGMKDLNTLVSLPEGIILIAAYDINNEGQVIARATIVPEPTSYALMLTGLSLIGAVVRRKTGQPHRPA